MEFEWRYQGSQPRKLRTVLKAFGVTTSLLKVAIFHGGHLAINGAPAWAINLVNPGDWVSITVPDEPANPKVPAWPDHFKIAYEDRDFLVIDKAAGVATVPAHHVAQPDSLVNQVKGYYVRQAYPNQVTHVATRLDKDTSGLVVFPKHRFAHAVLDRQLKAHQVQKEYLAIARGQIATQHGYLDAPIQRDPTSFVKRMVAPGGKPSVTEYWLTQAGPAASVLRVRLHTGRTHQIRVHFAYLGHPLLGDRLYGDGAGMARQALHCAHLVFYSPFRRTMINLRSPLPADMRGAIAALRAK